MQPSPPKIALITGITGQDGYYLSRLLLAKGYEVHGLVRRSSRSSAEPLEPLSLSDSQVDTNAFTPAPIQFHYGDMTDAVSLHRIVDTVEPDEVYNLAAQSHVLESFAQPVHTSDVAGMGALRLLEACKNLRKRKEVKFLQAGSSEMFGRPRIAKIDESTPFAPQNPLACAKAFAHYHTAIYRQAYGMFACNAILFNHESPRRDEAFVTRKITRGASRIREGIQDSLKLGNISFKRDWGYAPEYVEGMWMMMQHSTPEDFLFATGSSNSVQEFVELAFSRLGLPWQHYVKHSSPLTRSGDGDMAPGDSSKALELLGWYPQTNFESLVNMMVDADWQLARQRRPLRKAA